MRLGDLDALEKTIRENIRRYYSMETEETSGYCTATDAADEVKFAPTIDPEDLRPKGRWMDVKPIITGILWRCRCNLCGCPQDYKHNYCPNCGAKMEVDNG